MKLATIPAEAGFLATLAARWHDAHGGDVLARGLILLPTRRAARALATTFIAQAGGRPRLLPRIAALGAPDEAALALAGGLSLPPAAEAGERLGALAALVLKLPADLGGGGSADRALALARELAALMDEAERADVPLAEALERAADADYAAHWQVTLRFLRIVTEAWPAWLAGQGLRNPAARQVALLRAQAAAWAAHPPAEPVWIAGTTGGIPAVAELLRAVARLPQGRVVLPALDTELSTAAWAALGEAHPQAGMKRLLASLGARPEDVEIWPGEAVAPRGRTQTLSRALLPAEMLAAEWLKPGPGGIEGLWRLTAADEQEEAVSIAFILRDALETPGARAALVTPDRALAVRVAAELGRFGVVADDSAGEALAETPPAVLLRLLAEAVLSGFAPVALLALLKHPLAALGLVPANCRAAARALEAVLRGPKPEPGLAGLRQRANGAEGEEVLALVAALEVAAEPLLRVASAATAAPAEMLRALIAAGEAVAASDAESGPTRLWAAEEGEALAGVLAGALPGLGHLPEQVPAVLPGVLESVLEGAVVRSRRALRGRKGFEHPRVFIWGLLEARLQSAEVLVLGGLVEGVWPPATDPGPWMSRPMRARAGLPSAEEVVGQTAHDFFVLAAAAPTVIFSSPRRREGSPAVPARWLVRLEACLRGQGAVLPEHPAAAWARALDLPEGPPQPTRPPAPCPPVAFRPRRLSVTEIETWLADPYAIYARHILRLSALSPLEQETEAADYGVLVHQAMHRLIADIGTSWPADGAERARLIVERELEKQGLRRALAEWWRPRLLRIAGWVAEREAERRAGGLEAIAAEVSGEWELPEADGFVLRGRADRIERRAGGLAILDYKTGQLPKEKEVAAGFRPQLALEAAMARAGAFGPELAGEAAELLYWQLSGRSTPGEEVSLFGADRDRLRATVEAATDGLARLIHRFADPAQPYIARPWPQHAPRFSDYAQLARVAEWDLAEGGE